MEEKRGGLTYFKQYGVQPIQEVETPTKLLKSKIPLGPNPHTVYANNKVYGKKDRDSSLKQPNAPFFGKENPNNGAGWAYNDQYEGEQPLPKNDNKFS